MFHMFLIVTKQKLCCTQVTFFDLWILLSVVFFNKSWKCKSNPELLFLPAFDCSVWEQRYLLHLSLLLCHFFHPQSQWEWGACRGKLQLRVEDRSSAAGKPARVKSHSQQPLHGVGNVVSGVFWSDVATNEWNSFCLEYNECLWAYCKQACRGLVVPWNKKTRAVLKIEMELRNNVFYIHFCLRLLPLPAVKMFLHIIIVWKIHFFIFFFFIVL